MTSKHRKVRKQTQVLVVDDHPLVRFALSHLLNNTKDLRCCGEADGVAAARMSVNTLKPDLVLLDLSLGDGDGFGLISEWKKAWPAMRIIVISRHDEAVYAERSLRSGADGFVTKEETPDQILSAVRIALTGQRYVSSKLVAQVERRLLETPMSRGREGIDSLSDRELQVFRMLGEGRNNKEIAQQLELIIQGQRIPHPHQFLSFLSAAHSDVDEQVVARVRRCRP